MVWISDSFFFYVSFSIDTIFSQAFAALRAMPQVKRCGYYPEKSAATAARPAAKPAHVSCSHVIEICGGEADL
ncbi:hypothetical protein CGMCC3_g1074 [Colletotrichum fructicola]|nr:uncharacterized protein CGMCC3_g1074 [Colletotrichum fructicola]KAE9582945.1 hypothetical protein CGMCC3_g1074 [Colletotrichum fructicola]